MNATTNPMADFLAALEHAAELGKEVAALEKQTVEEEAQALTTIVAKTLPVLRYIDYKIRISASYSGHLYHEWQYNYLPEKGIVLVDKYGRRYTNRDYRGSYDGTMLVLTRSGKLLHLARDGHWSNWQGESCWWQAEVQEVTPEQAIERYGLQAIVEGLVKEFKEAIKDNENKKQVLEKRLELLEQVKALL